MPAGGGGKNKVSSAVLTLGTEKYPLSVKGEKLWLGDRISMPLHSAVPLPGALNKKELYRRHVTITRTAGVVRLYVEGFQSPGNFTAPGVPALCSTETAFFYNRAKKPAEIRALFRARHFPGKGEMPHELATLWENFIAAGTNFLPR